MCETNKPRDTPAIHTCAEHAPHCDAGALHSHTCPDCKTQFAHPNTSYDCKACHACPKCGVYWPWKDDKDGNPTTREDAERSLAMLHVLRLFRRASSNVAS